MYSPKISDEHIPALYRLARSRGISMTALINETVGTLLAQAETQAAIAAVAIPPKLSPARPAAARTRRPRAVDRAQSGSTRWETTGRKDGEHHA